MRDSFLIADNDLVYLDPHFCQDMVDMRHATFPINVSWYTVGVVSNCMLEQIYKSKGFWGTWKGFLVSQIIIKINSLITLNSL